MRYAILIMILVLFSMSCTQSKSKPITEFSQNDINNGILIDVRTTKEYDEGHIDEALNINWYDSDFANQMRGIDKDKTIYLYCKKGGRSAKAAKLLDSLGYNKVVDLEGGYDAWKEK